jgi:hypothetical protein
VSCAINYAIWFCSEHRQVLNGDGKCCRRKRRLALPRTDAYSAVHDALIKAAAELERRADRLGLGDLAGFGAQALLLRELAAHAMRLRTRRGKVT